MTPLEEDVRRFRAAMERSDFSDPEGVKQLCGFPGGSCKFASWLLARYLMQERGHGPMDYAQGMRWSDTYSHGWVEYGGLIIDITGDQFGQHRPPVVVTEDRSWHNQQFGEPGRRPFDEVFARLAEDWKLRVDRSYAEVMKNIDT